MRVKAPVLALVLLGLAGESLAQPEHAWGSQWRSLDLAGQAEVLLLAAKVATGDDDDIDDLIVERAADRKRAGGSDAKESEGNPSVGSRPGATTGASPPPAAASPLKRINCGTFWTGWADKVNPKTNPCPADCEPGDKLQEKSYQQGRKTLVDRQYQCYRATDTRSSNLQGATSKTMPLSSEAIGSLTPASGNWGAFVRVRGANFGRAERVSVLWYPDDDDTQAALMNQTATLRGRVGANEIEIQIPGNPAKSGWGSGDFRQGTLRVYLAITGQINPVLAGRFILHDRSASAQPVSITTGLVSMTGRWPAISEAVRLTSEPVRMTGRWPANAKPIRLTAELVQMTGRWPVAIEPVRLTTQVVRMTGRWPTTVAPVTVTTETVRITGQWPL